LPGDYTITLADPGLGAACLDVFTVTLDPPPPSPMIALEAVMPPGSPSGNDGSMTIVITEFVSPPFTVLLNGVNWGMVSEQVFTIGELAGGTYEVMVVNANGCTSNVLLVEIPFSRPGWQLSTNLTTPPVIWAVDGGPEHPAGEVLPPGPALGGAVAYQWPHHRRLHLAWWSGPTIAGQAFTGRLGWQQGWYWPRWSLHTGPALFLTDQLPGGAAQWAWQSDAQWRIPGLDRLQLVGEWALGRQDDWWVAGQLGLMVRW
jgi:hypothetical protein